MKKKYTVYVHSADILEFYKYLLIKNLLSSILNNASKIICNSNFMKNKLHDIGIKNKSISVIFPRIDFNKYDKYIDSEPIYDKYNLLGNKIILSINSLIPRKGNDIVIRALNDLKEKIYDFVYVIIGDGPYMSHLKKLVNNYNLNDYIIFTGSVSDNEKMSFYQACDVFIMLSREIISSGEAEGFGMVFLEANASGKPVIGGNSGGIPDAVIDYQTGLLVDPTDVKQTCDAILKILTDKELANSLAENGKQRVKDNFDWRNIITDEIL